MQFDWLRAFRPTSQEQDFSKILDFCINTASKKQYRTNSVKVNDKIFLHIQKKLFLAYFFNFGGKEHFSKKFGCHAQLHDGS